MTAPTRDPADEDFLDQVFERAYARLENGEEVSEAEFAAARPELLGRILAVVREARAACVRPAPRPLPAGPILPDYEILAPLGRGGMGTVYLARDTTLGREVALKVLPASAVPSPDARRRFLQEARGLARVRHPHVVGIHAVVATDAVCALAMERIQGRSLADLIGLAQQPAPPDRLMAVGAALGTDLSRDRGWTGFVVRVGSEIATALTAVHAEGLLHRDVKPSNILVRNDGVALLADFGLVRELLPDAATQHTQSGRFVGTLQFAPPEQLRGERASVDARSDVYSLGATLYQALTLRLPFRATSTAGMLTQVTTGAATRVRTLDPSLPADLDVVIAKAMDPDPAQRYQDAAALAEDLQRVLALRPILARRAGVVRRARRVAQRHPAAAVALGLGLLCALVVAVALGLRARALARQLLLPRDRLMIDGLLRDEPRWHRVDPRQLAVMERWLVDAGAVLTRREADAGWRDHGAQVPGRAEGPAPSDAHATTAALAAARAAITQVRASLAQADVTDASAAWMAHWVAGEQVRLDRMEQEPPGHLPRAGRVAAASRPGGSDAEPDALRADLDHQIDRLRRAVDRVATRLPRARADMAAWREALHSLWPQAEGAAADRRTTPRYGGLVLRQQADLVPIGRDPESGLLEFAHLPTGEPATRDAATGRLLLREPTGLVLVLVPGGTVQLGATVPGPGETDGEDHRDSMAGPDEPRMAVRLDPFFASKFELTQAQWRRLTGSNPSWYAEGQEVDGRVVTGLHPVESVLWEEASAALGSTGLALPTDVQWEHLCRAGTTSRWWTGAEVASLQGAENLADAGSLARSGVARATIGARVRTGEAVRWDDGWRWHAPVGSFRPNPFGLFDVLGNVEELCRDTAPAAMPERISPPRPGDGLWRVEPVGWSPNLRGGGFERGPKDARSSARFSAIRGIREVRCGMRPVRPLDP